MTSTLPLVCLFFIIATSIQLHHVNSQLSALVTGLPQIIKLLEEVTDTSASFIPNQAALLKNHKTLGNLTYILLQNNTAKLDVVTTVLSRMEEFMQLQQEKQDHAIITSVQTHQNTVTQMTNLQSQALNQMVSVLQMQSQQLQNISASLTTTVALLTTLSGRASTVKNASDCSRVSRTLISGVYAIQPDENLHSFNAYCDMDTEKGGWTISQRHFDGFVDFFLGWDDYEQRFGNVWGEYWLGLQQIHQLTSSG